MSEATLVVDLGDGFTKAIASGPNGEAHWRIPSIVARRLVRDTEDLRELSLDHGGELLRPSDFDPDAYPRTRSYPGAERVLRLLRAGSVEPRTRFAGGIAAVYGADRQSLGQYPTRANVEALVHKVVMLLARTLSTDALSLRLLLVVDGGAKARSIDRWVEAVGPGFDMEVSNFRDRRYRRLSVALRSEIVDSALCAATALPPEVGGARTLVVDVGHFGSKLAIVSAEGCELEERVFELGTHSAVRAVLRDGQDQRLFEDEYAVTRALENASGRIEIAGRRFDVAASVERAKTSLSRELGRAVERAALGHFRKRGDVCQAVAIIGGGAELVGTSLSLELQRQLDTRLVWVEPSRGFLVAEGGLRWARTHGWD